MNKSLWGLIGSVLIVLFLAQGIWDAWQILVVEKKTTPFKSPILKSYLNTYQGALWVENWDYDKAEEFFRGNSDYNSILLPFVASLNSTEIQKILKDLGSSNYQKWWDNVSTSISNKINVLEQHLETVDGALAGLSGHIKDVLKDQDYVQAYNKLLRWNIYLSALTCSLYFEDYSYKIKLLLDVTKKDKEVLDKMIFKLGNIKASNPLDQKCIDDFKNYLINTRESFFLLEQILDWFLNKISKQANLIFEDPLACLAHQKNIKSDMKNTLQELATQILSISQNILEVSKKLEQLSRAGQLSCKSLANVQDWDQWRWKDLSDSLNKLNQMLNSSPKKDKKGQNKKQYENDQRGPSKSLYEEIKEDEDIKRVEEESLEQIKETSKQKKYFPFYESVKNYFEEFYGKRWAKDKKTEGEILNEWW